eukprot:12429856-Karenia_brevis.AAC.1
MTSIWPGMSPKWHQEVPEMAQGGPRRPQDGLRNLHGGSNRQPERPKWGLQQTSEGPKRML